MSAATSAAVDSNPVLRPSTLPLSFPHFDKIKSDQFRPAFEAAMEEHSEEIAAIADSEAEPTFDNVLVALEKAGQTLGRVNGVFQHLNHAATDDTLQAIDTEYSPKLTAHFDAIMLNSKLFKKIDALYANTKSLNLDAEASRLLWRYHTDFVRAGAKLDAAAMEKLKALNGELATLETKFQQAVLAEVADSAVWFDNEADLEGFSKDELAVAKEAADKFVEKDDKKKGGAFLVKLMNTTQQPVLVQLKNPETRKKILKISMARGNRGGQHDTRDMVCSMARKRAEKAKLLGYSSHAAFVLEDEMAGTPEKVLELLSKLAKPALANAEKEAEELRNLSGMDAKTFCAADWDHYAEQLRAKKYGFDTDSLKPYFELNRVVNDGLFFAAEKLYGIKLTQRTDLPVYHDTIKVYDVTEGESGEQVGIFFTDFYSRDNKMGGAWMSETCGQSGLLGTLPVIDNHSNVPPPAEGKPTLLDLDHLTTAFHEFGHGLHGLLSKVKYPKFAGTSVSRDAVECPSQLNETWALHPQVAPNYLKHYETGEPLDPAVINKVRDAAKFNQGYATTEYLAACFLDLGMHLFSEPEQVPTPETLVAWETETLKKYGAHSELVPPRYRCTYFMHSFGGGYSAAYNSYVGSEVLDADCETWFKENGGLSRKNGDHFRNSVLCRGNSMDFNVQIKNFLGREPRIEPLLERRGLN